MIVVVNDLCSLFLCGQVLMIVGVNHLLGVVIVSLVFLCVCACVCLCVHMCVFALFAAVVVVVGVSCEVRFLCLLYQVIFVI